MFFMVVTMIINVFCDVTPCILVDCQPTSLRNLLSPSSSSLKMEARGSSEALVIFYQTTWRHFSEGSNLPFIFIYKLFRTDKWIWTRFARCEVPMGRSQWPRSLRHEMSSPAWTLRSWARIPLEAWMFVCVYSVFVLSCVSSGLATGWSPIQGVLPTVYKCKVTEPRKRRPRPEMGCKHHWMYDEVPMERNMKITLIWYAMPSGSVDSYQYFRGMCSFCLQAYLKMEGA
jgi:hypothetical protein